ncbi:hypothetical protein [Candidatus Enterovibrio altilux]|nr:hypothetical protein [Candidatus Enterovibrio luxaltus]
MTRVKKLLKEILSLRNHIIQISETCTIIKALNELVRLSMPNTKEIV